MDKEKDYKRLIKEYGYKARLGDKKLKFNYKILKMKSKQTLGELSKPKPRKNYNKQTSHRKQNTSNDKDQKYGKHS